MKKIITRILKWIEKSLRRMASKVHNIEHELNDRPGVRGGFRWMLKHYDELLEKYGSGTTIVIHKKRVVGVIKDRPDGNWCKFNEECEKYWKIYGDNNVFFQYLNKDKNDYIIPAPPVLWL